MKLLVLILIGSISFISTILSFDHLAESKKYLEEAELYKQQGKINWAIKAYQKALVINPQDAVTHHELGMLFAQEEQYDDAINHLQRASQLQPNTISFSFDEGCICTRVGKLDQAIEAYARILEKKSTIIPVLYNIGYAHKIAGNIDQAIKIYKQVLMLSPEYEPAHLGLAFAYIAKGDFFHGWQEHKWNLKRMNKNADQLRQLLQEGTIYGKTVLLRPEGGLGDSIHFIRYAQHLHELGAHIIVSIQQPLISLFSRCPYIHQLIPSKGPSPMHDASSSLMSLPAIFHDTELTMPRNIPYIFPDPILVDVWQKKLQSNSNFKIGICWQSDIYNDSSRLPIARRGIPLEALFCLKSIANISWYSLQKKEGLDQLNHLPDNFYIHAFDDFDETNGSFMDTAALMQQLDLIITIDSAVAHLAGSLGRPIWLLLPYSTDWRWIHNRTDSPWYPTMRIFKQPKPFDWASVIDEVYFALEEIIALKN